MHGKNLQATIDGPLRTRSFVSTKEHDALRDRLLTRVRLGVKACDGRLGDAVEEAEAGGRCGQSLKHTSDRKIQ